MAAVTTMRSHDAVEFVLDRIDDERQGRMEWVYGLYEIYRRLPDLPGDDNPRRQLLNEVSTAKNIAADTVEGYLLVPERIPLESLHDTFPRVGDRETWCARLTWSHLDKAAQAGGARYGPADRIGWLIKAADEEMSLAQFTTWLRSQGVIKARQQGPLSAREGETESNRITRIRAAVAILQSALSGEWGQRAKGKAITFWNEAQDELTGERPMPTTACELLERMAEGLRRQGIDIDLSAMMSRRRPDRPFQADVVLSFLAGEFKRERPGAEFKLTEEGGQ